MLHLRVINGSLCDILLYFGWPLWSLSLWLNDCQAERTRERLLKDSRLVTVSSEVKMLKEILLLLGGI